MKKYMIAGAICAFSLSTAAQDLSTEIVVDRTIVPEIREAVRLSGLTPELIAPAVKPRRLSQAEYNGAGSVTPAIGVLPAAPWNDSTTVTPWRGYASAGYFPTFNVGANAGYRFIDNKNFNVGARFQYTGNAYKDDFFGYKNAPFANNYITLGADGRWNIDAANTLALDLQYDFAAVKTPFAFYDPQPTPQTQIIHDYYDQRANTIDASLAWKANSGQFAYGASASIEGFFMGDNHPAIYSITPMGVKHPAMKQTAVTMAATFGLCDNEATPWLAADVDWTFLGSRYLPLGTGLQTVYRKASLSLGHINPYFTFSNESNLTGRVGLNASIATGNGNGHLRVAPDVNVTWHPLKFTTLFASAGGGEKVNLMSTLFDINPYVTPFYAYERTNKALDIDAGMRYGPMQGFSVGVSGGFDIDRGYLSPMIIQYLLAESAFARVNVNSWHVKADIAFAVRDILSVAAAVQRGGSNNDFDSFTQWRDAARYVVDANLTFTAVKNLKVMLDFNLRTNRKCRCEKIPLSLDGYILYSDNSPGILTPEASRDFEVKNLGNLSHLNLGATYSISPSVTVFGFVQNLLNHHNMLISGVPAQGTNGLCGVAFKF